MFDLSVRLSENADLRSLLSHYARLGTADRAAWQDRVMRMDGVTTEQLTTLHGALLALDAVEQNTGHAVLRPDGTLAACYRVTPTGLREFRGLDGLDAVEEQSEMTGPPPRPPRKKKERAEGTAASG